LLERTRRTGVLWTSCRCGGVRGTYPGVSVVELQREGLEGSGTSFEVGAFTGYGTKIFAEAGAGGSDPVDKRTEFHARNFGLLVGRQIELVPISAWGLREAGMRTAGGKIPRGD